MLSDLLLMLLLATVAVNTKPLTEISAEEGQNEIDHGSHSDYKNPPGVTDPVEDAVSQSRLPIADIPTTSVKRAQPPNPLEDEKSPEEEDKDPKNIYDQLSTALGEASATKPPGATWVLTPFFQKVQFSPRAFFQDKLGQLKETLTNLGIHSQSEDGPKQLGTNGLLNLIGLNDSGFYTDRLDPVGFFGGNGWFANKGGILGAPGALFSTGSVLTDYPTPYKK